MQTDTTKCEQSEWNRILKASRQMSSVTQAEVADALGCSLPTYITKERNPERFTLAEFAIVFSMLSVLGRTNLKTIIDSIFSDTPDPRDFTGGDGS